MALKFSMILEAVDRVTAPARKMRSSVSQLTAGIRRWGQDVRRVSQDIESGSRSLDHYQRRARRLRQVAIGSVFRVAGLQARRFATDLRAGIRNLDLMGRAGRGAMSGLKWMGGKALGAAKWGVLGAAATAAATGGWFLSGIVSTGAHFEQLQAQLEGTEGSADKAKKALQWVLKFAKDTPYAVEGVAEAFVRARNLGIDPFTGAMMSMGDAAAANNQTLTDAVEAIGDAQTKEYERLKTFGITSSTKGNLVTFSFVAKDGKNAFKTVKNDAASIRKTVLGIWDAKYAGGMIRQSKTLVGLWENIKDTVTAFQYKIAEAGWFNRLKESAASFLDKLNEWSEDGTLDQWALKISAWLTKATDLAEKFIKETDWDQVAADLKSIADNAMIVVNALRLMVKKAEEYRDVIRNLPIVGPSLRFMEWMGSGDTDRASSAPNKPAPKAPDNWWNRPTVPNLRNPQIRGRTSAAAPVQVGGALQVDVRVQGPGTARVTSVTSNNPSVPVKANTGKIMDGAA
ncbi:tape measure protein [Novosphingobium clariflavum]|uniref:Tape measure protein n=1 Tax=Novosphingobium clariflavum TaxID=2029884 RepID=A0ABV6SAV4_9SPHN|nr:tape measure protein [Novosphingobium clariflavum]